LPEISKYWERAFLKPGCQMALIVQHGGGFWIGFAKRIDRRYQRINLRLHPWKSLPDLGNYL
jgi:hypothetical protein